MTIFLPYKTCATILHLGGLLFQGGIMHKKSFKLGKGLALAIFFIFPALVLFGADNLHRVWAVKDCRILTMTGPEISRGTIVMRDGLVEAVGVNVAIPADAEVIDGDKLVVYPGLIDGLSQALLKFPEKKIDQLKYYTAEFTDEDKGINPERRAFDFVSLDKGTLDKYQRLGVTVVQVISENGIFSGQSSVFLLADGDKNRALLLKDVLLGVGFSPEGVSAYPSSQMGVMAFLRQEFSDARHYLLHKNRWQAERNGLARPLYNPRYETLADFASEKKALVFFCRNQHDIRRALQLASENQLDYFICDLGNEAFRVIPELLQAKARVFCPLTFKAPGSSIFSQQGRTERERAEKEIYPKNSLRLAEAGIPFAFSSLGNDDPKSFLEAVQKAVENGLPKAQALEALTIRPAAFMGLSKALGAIRPGAIVNLVVGQGEPLSKEAKIKYVFLDSRKIEIKDSQAQGNAKPEVNVSGKWELNIESAGLKLQTDFVQDEALLSGKMVTPFGVFDFSGGSVSGKEIYFEMTITAGGQIIDLFFTATVSGDTMEGSAVQGTQGSMEFRGKRIPF
jgi:imidazolonepropionase-like amidohydrolase